MFRTDVVTKLKVDPQAPAFRPDRIILGGEKGELNLVPLQPKQDKAGMSDCDASDEKVLNSRLNETDSAYRIMTPKRQESYRKEYIKKNFTNHKDEKGKKIDNKKYMKMFRLMVTFTSMETSETITSVSSIVRDTGSKETGSMEIQDVTPRLSCTQGGRKVIIASEYELDTEHVVPELQVEH